MIFFDIDGTLIDHASASEAASLALYDEFSSEVPFPRENFPATWEEIMTKHFNRFCRGEISIWDQRRARIREVFARPALSDAETDARYYVFIRNYESRTQAFEDVLPCLEQLRSQKLGIISNGAREQQIGKLQRAGILEYFSVTVFSEDTGLGKPSEKIFLEACRHAQTQPAACVHIGDDRVADVAGSHALGMQPVWLDRADTRTCETPALRITTLKELTEVVAAAKGAPQEQLTRTAM